MFVVTVALYLLRVEYTSCVLTLFVKRLTLCTGDGVAPWCSSSGSDENELLLSLPVT